MDLVARVTKEIARLRKERGITQEALAELLDVPVQHVSRIEAGQNITLATLERISTALGVKANVTFTKTSRGPQKPPQTRRQKLKARK